MTECLKCTSISARKRSFRKPIFRHFISVKPKQSAVGELFFKRPKKKKNLQRFLHILGHKRNSLSQGEGIYPVRVFLHWHYITKVTKDWCAWGVKHILEYNLVPLNNHFEQKDTEQDLFLQICIWPVLVLLRKFQPQVEGKNGSTLDGSFFKCVTCMCHSIGGNPPGKDPLSVRLNICVVFLVLPWSLLHYGWSLLHIPLVKFDSQVRQWWKI